MTLFDFEYIPYESKSYVKPAGISVVNLRTEIIGFKIVWELRHKIPRERKRENRDFLKKRIEYLKEVKFEYPFAYKEAHELSYLQAVR